MGDLAEDDFGRLIVEIGALIAAETGFSPERAEALAAGVLELQELDGDQVILRDVAGDEVARVSEAVLAPLG